MPIGKQQGRHNFKQVWPNFM